MSAVLLPNGKQQYLSQTGVPLVGGRVYTYDTGTTTPRGTWQDAAQVSLNTNPIILDGRGEAPIFWNGAYRVVVTDSLGNAVWTMDGVSTNDYGTGILTDLANFTVGTKGAGLVGYGPSVTYNSNTVGSFLGLVFGRTAEEIAAGVTPTNYNRLPQDIRRYGADPTGAADSVPAIHSGWLAYSYLYAVEGVYKVGQPIIATGIKVLDGQPSGSQSAQIAALNHTGAGNLWTSTSNEFEGVCLQNFEITGGNGGYAIVNARPQSAFRNLHMETYNGSGIDLKDGTNGTTAPGSWGCLIENCKWVGPASATAYRGYRVSVNGGNTILRKCTAIRGSVGIELLQGENIVIEECNLNLQDGVYSSESLSTGQCGIRLTGNYVVGPPITGYKQAITIRKNYLESCSNNIWIDSVQSCSIADNYFDDNASGGPNVTLKAEANNVSIRNNHMLFRFTGGVVNNILNGGTNTVVEDNDIELVDTTPPTAYWLETTTACLYGNNRAIDSARVPITYNGVLDVGNLAIDTKPVRGSFTGTLTGCTTSPTAAFKYTYANGMVTMLVPSLTAVSNTTACTITGVPAAIRPLTLKRIICRIVDNSVTAFGMVELDPAVPGTMTLGVGPTFTTFTAANNKGTSNTEISWGLE